MFKTLKRNPNSKEFWEDIYRHYIEIGRIRSDGEHLLKFRDLFEEAGTILDFGAGLGGDIKYISGLVKNTRFALADQSEVCLEYADNELLGTSDERGNSYSYHRDVNEIEAESSDMVISLQVLEHITEYQAVLDLLWAKVKPGGILLISVPVKGWRDRHRQHVNKFTIKSMFRLMSNYNEIVQIAIRDYSKKHGRLATAYFYVRKPKA